MTTADWEDEAFKLLITFGKTKKIMPNELVFFLMKFCAECFDVCSDEQDVKVYAKVFYDIVIEWIELKKMTRKIA